MSELKVYHGSYCEVERPSLDKGRLDADFGIGFYVSSDLTVAEKWASRKKKAVINEYVLYTDKLNAYSFPLNEEWLDFVIQNRNGDNTDFFSNKFDLLIGVTADDKLFATIEQYESGFIDVGTAVEILNCVKVNQQICVRTERGLDNLHFSRSIELSPEHVNKLREINRADRMMANQLTSEIIRNRNMKNNRTQPTKKMSLKSAVNHKKEVVEQRQANRQPHNPHKSSEHER